jgi:Zn ribbon nucleic-acid-binding protein
MQRTTWTLEPVAVCLCGRERPDDWAECVQCDHVRGEIDQDVRYEMESRMDDNLDLYEEREND